MGSSNKGGDSGRQQDALDQQIYDQFYDAGLSGGSYSWEGAADREVGAQMGYEAGQAARPVETPDYAGMLSSMMETMTSSMSAAVESTKDTAAAAAAVEDDGPSYEEQLAEQERELAIARRDTLYSGYMDAAGSAADYVNNEITQERSNARLLGIDYNVTDQQKTDRVNDYFSTIWGESDHSELQSLVEEHGGPEGFDGFTVSRGTGGSYAEDGTKPGVTEKTSTASKGPGNILDEEEEDEETLGAGKTILGGS